MRRALLPWGMRCVGFVRAYPKNAKSVELISQLTKRLLPNIQRCRGTRGPTFQWAHSFITVAILAQGTSRAVVVTAFSLCGGSGPGRARAEVSPLGLFSRPHANTAIQSEAKGEEKTKADNSLKASRAVPHPSTDWALRRLTSDVGRDPMHSTRYHQRMLCISNVSFVRCSAERCRAATWQDDGRRWRGLQVHQQQFLSKRQHSKPRHCIITAFTS